MKPVIRKGIKYLLPCAALCLTVGFIILRDKGDARFISSKPVGMCFIPASDFRSHKLIDIPWFGGGRLIYPKPEPGLPNDPALSAICEWPMPHPNVWQEIDMLSYKRAMGFRDATWMRETDGSASDLQPFSVYGSNIGEARNYVGLPYVYGSHPMRFQLTWLDTEQAMSEPKIVTSTIELPPNHREPPTVSQAQTQLGKFTIHFIPVPLISPGFARRYQVHVESSNPSDSFAIDIFDIDNSDGMYTESATIVCLPGKPAVYVAKGDCPRLGIRLRLVNPIHTPAVARLSSASDYDCPVYKFFTENGEMLARSLVINGHHIGWAEDFVREEKLKFVGVVIAGHPVRDRYAARLAEYKDRSPERFSDFPIKDGQTFDTIAYRVLECRSGQIKIGLPPK